MDYHLYRRTVKKNGKDIKVWYYWFYDESGKQVRKSCGCQLKRDAEKYIELLLKQDEDNERLKSECTKVRLRDVALDMFRFDSVYMKLYVSRGAEITPQTLKQKIRLLNKHILPIFGDSFPCDIHAAQIENWIVNLTLSNSSKNNILAVLKEIFIECKRNQIISDIPEIKPFRRKSKKKDIITLAEIKKLFPNSLTELEKIWLSERPEYYIGVDNKNHNYDLMFAIMFKLILVTGMRMGEVIALSAAQFKENGFILNRMIDSEKKLCFYLKKGNVDNPKTRAVIIPDTVSNLIRYYLTIKPKCDKDFLFTYHDDFVKKELVERRFKKGLLNNKILDGRKITPHSLRFTYNTYMVNAQFPQEALRKMIGHNAVEMTDYYTRPDLDSELAGLLIYKKAIDAIWN